MQWFIVWKTGILAFGNGIASDGAGHHKGNPYLRFSPKPITIAFGDPIDGRLVTNEENEILRVRSDAFEGGEGDPAVVVADLDVGVADVAILYSAPLLCPVLPVLRCTTAVLRLASPAPQPYALLLCIPAPPPCTPAPAAPTAVSMFPAVF